MDKAQLLAVEKYVDSLPVEQRVSLLTELEKQERILLARRFSVEGFCAFYRHVYGRDVPKHWLELPPDENGKVVRPLDEVFANKEVVLEAFRGSTKTTTFSNAFPAYYLGHHPEDFVLIVQVEDESASDNSATIADIIANLDTWKDIFPNVVPDEKAGWGATGYDIMRTDILYSEWRTLVKARRGKDPSFVGLGYKSRALIGKHPHVLIVDDIHDENNTMSDRELLKVKTILTGTILVAASYALWQFFIGTPWSEKDMLHYLLTTGEYHHIKVPVRINGQNVWPEEFDDARIQKERNKAGEIEAARMYWLDLSKTKGLVLNRDWIDTFDHDAIMDYWDTYIGIDYSSTADPRKTDVDYFALAVGKMIPGIHKLVIVDGIRERVTQADAELAVVSKAREYPRLIQIGVEAIITGDEFLKVLLRSDLLKAGIVPEGLKGGPFQKSKGYRYEKIMGPAFQRKQVLLSTAENEFINTFRDEYLNWQGDAMEKQYHNDTLDAVFNVIWMAMPNFARRIGELEGEVTNPLWRKKKSQNPFVGLRI